MERGKLKKMLVGTVVSDKMDKTVVVAVNTLRWHPLYRKQMKRTTRYKVHDEDNECRVGDRVRVMQSRPLSRDKRFRVVGIIERVEV